ncbi:MAG: hypothetical protein LBT46_04245 [Planctomycetaceae bacterium]|jgi:hypothetical protein|nr:hypothetical protein [Planctomycetaceae bacterium]
MKHFIAITLLLLVTAGCGQKYPPGMPPLYPCQVTIVQEGKPVLNAKLVFHETEQGTATWAVSSLTNTGGVANMSTNGPYAGVPAGTYKITVEKIEEVQEAKGYYHVDLVDVQYRTADTTPLQVEVTKRKKSNVFSFDVGAEVQEKVSGLMPYAPKNPIEEERERLEREKQK